MASMSDVAKRAGVGTTTVSRVINNSGYVSKSAYARVMQAIEELEYAPNQLGKNLRNKKTNIIVLIVPTIGHPFFSKLAYYIENELYRQNYKLMLINTQDNPEKEGQLVPMIRSGQVEGIIYVSHHKDKIDFKNIPIVTLDRHIENVPCITSDNYEASKRALYYLKKEGCNKIAFIGGKSQMPSETSQRFKAYLDFCKETENEEIYSYTEFKHGEEIFVAKTFLNKNEDIDGIFSSSDLLANACYYYLKNKGINVPEDVKIIGYDGVYNDTVPVPKYTVVKQKLDALAKELVRVLILRITNQETNDIEYIPSEFVLGDTA